MKHMAVSENDVMVINQWIYHDFMVYTNKKRDNGDILMDILPLK